jgi:hypothetical protein
MASFQDNLRGILTMTAANSAFLLNDTQVKLAAGIYTFCRERRLAMTDALR